MTVKMPLLKNVFKLTCAPWCSMKTSLYSDEQKRTAAAAAAWNPFAPTDTKHTRVLMLNASDWFNLPRLKALHWLLPRPVGGRRSLLGLNDTQSEFWWMQTEGVNENSAGNAGRSASVPDGSHSVVHTGGGKRPWTSRLPHGVRIKSEILVSWLARQQQRDIFYYYFFL